MTKASVHAGSCHCGAVAYEVQTNLDGLVECDCSHCLRKGFVLAFVPRDDFRLTAEGPTREYLFNAHKIRHQFCPTCGVQPFAYGTMPDGTETVAVNVRTLTDIAPWDWQAERVNGRDF